MKQFLWFFIYIIFSIGIIPTAESVELFPEICDPEEPGFLDNLYGSNTVDLEEGGVIEAIIELPPNSAFIPSSILIVSTTTAEVIYEAAPNDIIFQTNSNTGELSIVDNLILGGYLDPEESLDVQFIFNIEDSGNSQVAESYCHSARIHGMGVLWGTPGIGTDPNDQGSYEEAEKTTALQPQAPKAPASSISGGCSTTVQDTKPLGILALLSIILILYFRQAQHRKNLNPNLVN